MGRAACTVSELNNYIKGLLDNDDILREVSVRGELSNYKIYPSGHHYFSLKDSESSLRCVMFKGSAAKLRFRPENGMAVTVFGTVSVYPRDGAYQLYCSAMIPEGAGDLQIAFEQLKEKLAAEGLFDRSCKKPLPPFPEKIAIITSAAGAAVHDMIRILGQRWPMTKVLLLPVRVQGVEAPAEIAGAIRYANEFKLADLIITGRGGGSIEDLWAFNDERVARAIFASEIPVISAVGHEPDVTISDYVADVRASTPSNAAELAVPDMQDLKRQLSMISSSLKTRMGEIIGYKRQYLQSLAERRSLKSPIYYVDSKQELLLSYEKQINSAFESVFKEKASRLSVVSSKLTALNPMAVLSRGYAAIFDGDGKVINSVASLKKDNEISLNVADGMATAKIVDIIPKGE